MKLSAFTPIGLLRLAGGRPLAAKMYRAMVANFGGQFDTSKGTTIDAWCFANARGQARAQMLRRAASLQNIPQRASFLLPVREKEYGIIPGANATLQDRRREFAARKLAAMGSARHQIETALAALLGADFVAYRPTSVADTLQWSQLDSLDVNYQRPEVARKLVRIKTSLSMPGALAQIATYALEAIPVVPGQSNLLLPGDVLMVEPGRLGRAERVVVADVDNTNSSNLIFSAVFTKSHDANSLATTSPFPGYSTTKRHSLIVVKQAAAGDPEKRRWINELMRRMLRSTSTWDIVEQDPAMGTQTKLFQIGEPSIGRRTTATVTI